MQKTGFILLILLLITGSSKAQQPIPFFNQGGAINQSEQLTNDLSYSLTYLDNRADDVVWAHVVYSIIDLRDNRNQQLAFPIEPDANYKNLFRLITQAVTANVPVYYPNEAGISPFFSDANKVDREKMIDVFFMETDVAGVQYLDPLFDYNVESGTLSVSTRIYDRFSRRIQKYLVQKVYYFDKHLSQMSSKIIGIAPMISEISTQFPVFDDEEEVAEGSTALRNTLRESILCWFLYDELKPQLSSQLVYQVSNQAQRVSYHEYFTKKMFSDYLIGDNNLFKRLYGSTEDLSIPQLKNEISRIQQDLVEIEADIWGR